MASTTSLNAERSRKQASRLQKTFAATVALAAVSYLFLVTTGEIKPTNRLSAAEVGLLVVAALSIGVALRPDLVDRVQKLDFAGLKFELGEVKREQVEVQRQQQQQAAILEDVRLALRLLIGNNEQAHLINLHRHTTSEYRVKGGLRDEIRRLRAMKLIRMCNDKHVGGMPEKTTFDLADYVQLTEDGAKFAARLAEQPGVQEDGGASAASSA